MSTYDGYVILHSDGTDEDGSAREAHAIGPVPTHSLAEMLRMAMSCPCTKTIVGVSFPPGTRMLLEVDEGFTDMAGMSSSSKPELMN